MIDVIRLVRLHATEIGPSKGPPVVFLHTLGTHSGIWSDVLDLLPQDLRLICIDLRGHGLSATPAPPYSMGALIKDVEHALEHLCVKNSVLVGLGLGGLIAQGLAVKRLDLVRALLLSGSAAKIGHSAHWEADIAQTMTDGPKFVCEKMTSAWFGRNTIPNNQQKFWKIEFLATPLNGLLGAMHAIKGTDFYTPTSGLRLPTLGLAGSDDGIVPPDLMRETIDLIPGSDFQLIRKAGHLSCIDQPSIFAQHLDTFLSRIGHSA